MPGRSVYVQAMQGGYEIAYSMIPLQHFLDTLDTMCRRQGRVAFHFSFMLFSIIRTLFRKQFLSSHTYIVRLRSFPSLYFSE